MTPDEPTMPRPGLVYGIIDPDYARAFTIARTIAWQEGYALAMHGSFTRDLDLIAVPWADHACSAKHLVARIADAAGLAIQEPAESAKPHGRVASSLLFTGFTDPRWVDLSVMPRVVAAPPEPEPTKCFYGGTCIDPTGQCVNEGTCAKREPSKALAARILALPLPAMQPSDCSFSCFVYTAEQFEAFRRAAADLAKPPAPVLPGAVQCTRCGRYEVVGEKPCSIGDSMCPMAPQADAGPSKDESTRLARAALGLPPGDAP